MKSKGQYIPLHRTDTDVTTHYGNTDCNNCDCFPLGSIVFLLLCHFQIELNEHDQFKERVTEEVHLYELEDIYLLQLQYDLLSFS